MADKWVMMMLIAACDGGSAAPKPSPKPQTPTPVVAIDAALPAAPPAAAPPTPTIARWSEKSTPEMLASPDCIRAADRMIQYADVDHEAPRFCMWFHLEKPAADVGCWRVDVATGTYHPEGGVWFSSPQPARSSDGATLAELADGTTATLQGTQLEVGKARLVVRKGSIVLARAKDFVVIDRDGHVLVVDATAKLARTIGPPSCKKH